MNEHWLAFLKKRSDQKKNVERTAIINEKEALCALTDIGILAVTGQDAESFLQGQATCDIKQISEDSSGLGAFCNPKGRAITTFRIIKGSGAYYFLFAAEQLPSLQKRLQMYILRSEVKLNDATNRWCPMGITGKRTHPLLSHLNVQLPSEINRATLDDDLMALKIPGMSDRYLILGSEERAREIWTFLADQENYAEYNLDFWHRQDIRSGIPQITEAIAEEFVPQMLNLDLLGGISFNKGCYTGQEVVARTYYLGKLKRRMYRASCPVSVAPGDLLYDALGRADESVGKVVLSAPIEKAYEMLAVITTTHAKAGDIRVHSPKGAPIKFLQLPYALETDS